MKLWRLDAEFDGDENCGSWTQIFFDHATGLRAHAMVDSLGCWLVDYYELEADLAPEIVGRLAVGIWPALPLDALVVYANRPIGIAQSRLQSILANRGHSAARIADGGLNRTAWEGQ
jgi:hypothetical protein